MFSSMNAGGLNGMEAYPVRVEVDISTGLPCFELVGSVSSEVREAKERVQIALRNAKVSLPVSKITVNLSPADRRKEGTGYDLAIAAGLLACMGLVQAESLKETAFLGELALDGAIGRVKGVLPIAIALQKEGIRTLLVPKENAMEAVCVPEISIIGISDITEFMHYLQAGEEERENQFPEEKIISRRISRDKKPDFSDVHGQETAKRAAEVAAAGFHHLLLAGPPGAGKTMIASRLPTILPPLTKEESLEVASIYSIAGKLNGENALFQDRPFVAPHHTGSVQAMAGGGRIPGPGLISFAHRGVLFLDEMPEFSSDVLEVLRQPMENKKVEIARSRGIYTFPADFILVGAMNPCPCGYFPNRNRCSCTESEIRRYLGKISGPILDRIDMVAEVSEVPIRRLYEEHRGESSEKIRSRVMAARERQTRRYQDTVYHFNGELPGSEVRHYCILHEKEQHFMEQVFETGQMSARAYHKIVKLARTIADLEGKEEIAVSHLAEAVCYNSGRTRFWK